MRILVTGGTGFIGRALCPRLVEAGHKVTIVSRNPAQISNDWGLPTAFLRLDLSTQRPSPDQVADFDAVIHLMGESIADGRWTAARRQRLISSRVDATRHLAEALAQRASPLPVLISASAIGFYPYGDQIADEETPPGEHFLAQLCQNWEHEATQAGATRTALLRLGVVLGAEGGALATMAQPSRYGVGGPLGDGRQLVSWIHLDDLVALIMAALEDQRIAGPINAVAPEVVSQAELARAIGRALGTPSVMRTPQAALRLALGDMAVIALGSQGVRSKRLASLGFPFAYPSLAAALREALGVTPGPDGKERACRTLRAVQFIARPIDEVFPFFCDPKNLERLTPPFLQFRIVGSSTKDVGAGTEIDYRLRLHGIPVTWRTRIESWQAGSAFVDTQLSGPYKIWHHTHTFHSVPGGTLMFDTVRYRLPLGVLGETFGLPLVRRDVGKIFAYRRRIVGELFGTPGDMDKAKGTPQ